MRLPVVKRRASWRLLFGVLAALPACANTLTCQTCHPKQVEGYSHYSMARSLRKAANEPAGSFQDDFGTKFTAYTNESGAWQRMERNGEVSDYHVEYVIGSGKHAFGYLVRIGDHLFQSPIGYYTDRHAYAMAPGYERHSDADFTRPVTQECLLCHAGRALHISGTLAGYASPAFAQEAISCERCHGPTEEHLKRPAPGSIVNPAKLAGAARDSICEQCHLFGTTRVPNPDKHVEDFRPGLRLEDVFAVYLSSKPLGGASGELRVISHSEQLRASACARNSGGKLWCGSCHDLHDKPAVPAAYYRGRCLSCHAGNLPQAHAAASSDCVSCHMPRRQTWDGGHTVFTDHRIERRPETAGVPSASSTGRPDLIAWREPDPEFAARNLALAYITAGSEHDDASWVVRGYRMLAEVQTQFSRDAAVFKAFGITLLRANQPQEAEIAFERVVQLDPSDPVNEENAARADLASGDIGRAREHLEQAVTMDPLLLSSVAMLREIYGKEGDTAKEAALADKVRRAMSNSAAPRANLTSRSSGAWRCGSNLVR